MVKPLNFQTIHIIYLVFFLTTLASLDAVRAQETDSAFQHRPSKISWFFSPVKWIWQTEKKMFSLTNKNLQAAIVAGTAIAYAFDNRIDSYIVREQPISSQAEKLDKLGKQVNDFLWFGVLSTGLISRNKGVIRTGRNIIIAEVSANLIGSIAWYAIGRQRPQYSDNNHTFKPFQNSNLEVKIPPFTRLPSYPSMHAAGNFSIASVIAHQHGQKYAVPFYIFGAAVGYSRMAREGHYFSDIVGGALLGYLAGKATVSYFNSAENKKRNSVFIYPLLEKNSLGFNILVQI